MLLCPASHWPRLWHLRVPWLQTPPMRLCHQPRLRPLQRKRLRSRLPAHQPWLCPQWRPRCAIVKRSWQCARRSPRLQPPYLASCIPPLGYPLRTSLQLLQLQHQPLRSYRLPTVLSWQQPPMRLSRSSCQTRLVTQVCSAGRPHLRPWPHKWQPLLSPMLLLLVSVHRRTSRSVLQQPHPHASQNRLQQLQQPPSFHSVHPASNQC
mmetsp:Transcript_74029/g.190990  ORF Transcript_74029/g.190990 Transcript_74029/m.190990 type:complete len:207 (-) Transcript_74029:2225-2845(-)